MRSGTESRTSALNAMNRTQLRRWASWKSGSRCIAKRIIMFRVENRQRRIMGRKPIAIVRSQPFGRLQYADLPIPIGRPQPHVLDRAEAGDQKVDMPAAGQTENNHLLL
jgi:hypothetical protein